MGITIKDIIRVLWKALIYIQSMTGLLASSLVVMGSLVLVHHMDINTTTNWCVGIFMVVGLIEIIVGV